MMKKQIIIVGVTLVLIVVGLSGCVEDEFSFAAKVVGSNLKIVYACGPENVSDNNSLGIYVFIDTGYCLDLATYGTDLDGDGRWDPGDFVAVPVSSLSTNPCPVTVIARGTTILDTVIEI